MDNISQETLRKVEENDPSLTDLWMGRLYSEDAGGFYSIDARHYSALGTAIGNNCHLTELYISLRDGDHNYGLALDVTNREFYDGLHRNTSISLLSVNCNRHIIVGGVGHELLKAYKKNGNLTSLNINGANLQNGGDRVIVDTLRNCRNLRQVTLINCNITDEQLLPIVDAIRGYRMLEELDLFGNRIGNNGCDAIATLLADPNCNLQNLYLGQNNIINNESATTIANSLTNNKQLQQLYLYGNQIDQSIEDTFSNILCNTSSINSIYSSNHALHTSSFG